MKQKLFTFLCLCIMCVGNAFADYFEKVTSAPTDWSGEYLLVYEASSRVWNGLDVANGYVSTTISNGKISSMPENAVTLIIESMTGGYSIKINGGEKNGNYISGKSGSNTIVYGATAVANEITFSNGSVTILSNSTSFRYNAASGNDRFRYYKTTTTGDSYILPALYKKTESVTYAINVDGGITNGTVEASASKATAGDNISLTVTPADHYKLASLSVKDKADNDIPVTDNKFTMPSSDVTVSATFAEKAKFTVSYNALGETAGSEVVYDGELIAAAPTPTLAGWELIGWTTNDAYETSTTAPTAFELSTPITGNLNLYAVFQKTEGGDDATEELTNEEIISLSSNAALSYGIEKKYTDGAIDYSIYANTDQPSRHWLQLKKDLGSYIKITAPNNITKVDLTITSASNYSGGINTITLHSSFGGEVALVTTDCTYSTSSASIAKASEVKNNMATLIPSKDATAVYLKVSSGARIWGINVSYLNATTYYTTAGILTQDIEISAAGWATACLPFNATITSDNATAYYVTGINDSAIKKTEANVIPAGEGILLKSNNGSEANVTFTQSIETADNTSENMLKGSLTGETFNESGYTYYILSTGENGVGFYWDKTYEQDNTYKEGKAAECAAGKAVLAVQTGAGAPSFFTFDDATAINGISSMKASGVRYNLNGQAVGENYKGIVIVNGKKMFNK